MTDNPPPAPDWILGADGHWKPPPFTISGGVRPSPPPSPDGDAPEPPTDEDRAAHERRARRRLRRRERTAALWGLVAVLLVPLGWAATALDVWQVGDHLLSDDTPSVDPGEPQAAEYGVRPGDPVGVPGERGQPCAGPGEVAFASGQPSTEATSAHVEAEAVGVTLSGVECRYGPHLRSGEVYAGTDAVEALRDLAWAGTTEATITDEDAVADGVRVTRPGDPTVLVVWDVRGRERWLRVDPALAPRIPDLVSVVGGHGA